MNENQRKIEKLKLLRQKRILEARKSLWEFCKVIASDFYMDGREHLFILCNTLQALYEGRIIRQPPEKSWKIVESTEGLTGYSVCKRLILNLPPQHGKSRTLINFADWVFGKNPKEKIITCSYNDETASDFSRFTRDGIMQEKTEGTDICYSDIFPNTVIKDGNAAIEKWALQGQHFSYLGAGLGGSITGKGGTILIVDDPIKDAETAYNEAALDKIWRWYTGTFLSRVSAPGGEPIEIVNMTRWSKNDICGKILSGAEASEWYVLKMEAYDEANNKMLCPDLLSKKRYLSQRTNMDNAIFRANYHQEPVDVQGRLYQSFKTYVDVPKDENGNVIFESIENYTDTADTGTDFLCSICYGTYNKEAYVLDVYFTDKGMEVTEPATAKMLYENKVNVANVESNNGGRGFARNVEKKLKEKYKCNRVKIKWFHQSKNKIARILSNSTFVMDHIYFPVNWKDRWPEYYDAMVTYQREGKNKHDDAPDATTGISEMMSTHCRLKSFNIKKLGL